MYLIEYIKETQAQYPTSSQTPIDVLRHLFLTNGNGFYMLDGDISKMFGIREVKLLDLYKTEVPAKDYMTYFKERDNGAEIHKWKEIYLGLFASPQYKLLCTDEEIESMVWDLAVKQSNEIYETMDSIDNYTLEDLQDANIMYECLKKQDGNYYPRLHLSKGYFLMDKFNSSTDKDTVKIMLAVSKAYIKYMTEVLSEKDSKRKITTSGTKEQVIESITNDIKLLKQCIKKMSK